MEELIRDAQPGTMLYPAIFAVLRSGRPAGSAPSKACRTIRSSIGAAVQDARAPPSMFETSAQTFLRHRSSAEEVFGPSTVVVRCGSRDEMEAVARRLDGQLTATIHGTPADLAEHAWLVSILEDKAGRLIVNGFPTGVEVCASMQHGGPYPATTDSRTTSVGTAAILRFARPVAYQNFPQSSLPLELQDANPRGIWRQVDGELTKRRAGRLQVTTSLAFLPLSKQFKSDGMVRVPLQQTFERGDSVLRTVGAEMNPGQRHVRALVLRPPLKQSLEKRHRLVRLPARREDQCEVVGGLAVIAAAGQRITEMPFRGVEVAGAAGEQA